MVTPTNTIFESSEPSKSYEILESERIANLVEQGVTIEPTVLEYIKKQEATNKRQQKKIKGVILGQIDLRENTEFIVSPEEESSVLRSINNRDEKYKRALEIFSNIELPTLTEAIDYIEKKALYTNHTRRLHAPFDTKSVPESALQITGVMTKALDLTLPARELMLTNPKALEEAITRIREKYKNPLELKKRMENCTVDRVYHWTAATLGMLDAIYGKRYQYMMQLKLLEKQAEELNKSK